MTAMQSGQTEVQMQGVEFWSNVCENEALLIADAEDAADERRTPETPCYYYAKGALPQLVPALLQLLSTADADDDTDDWTVAKVRNFFVCGGFFVVFCVCLCLVCWACIPRKGMFKI
jgi:hypothetical protein